MLCLHLFWIWSGAIQVTSLNRDRPRSQNCRFIPLAQKELNVLRVKSNDSAVTESDIAYLKPQTSLDINLNHSAHRVYLKQSSSARDP